MRVERTSACPEPGQVPAFDAGWNAFEVGLERETVRLLTPPSGRSWALLAYDIAKRVSATTGSTRRTSIEYPGGHVSVGNEVLVDCTPYGVEGRRWCRVELLAPGSATPYPIRARVPGRGIGQWAPDEVQGIRGPAVLAID